jgi:tetratricopeptide (TPR) repeat protein
MTTPLLLPRAVRAPAAISRPPGRSFQAAAFSAAVLLAIPQGACGGEAAARKPSSAERLNGEGVRRLERGDAKGAEETFRDALEEAALVDDLQGQAEAWNNLGALAMARGRPDEALSCHRTALHLHRARGERDIGEIRSRANAGSALLALGRIADAEVELESAVALASMLGRKDSALLAQVGLASVALHKKQPSRAAALAKAAAETARGAGDFGALAAALAVEGAALDALGDAASARARFEEALEIDRKREAPFAVASDLRVLSRLAERRGDLGAASSYLARSARIARWMGDYERAERELRRALSLAREVASREIELIESELAELLRTKETAGEGAVAPVAAPIK